MERQIKEEFINADGSAKWERARVHQTRMTMLPGPLSRHNCGKGPRSYRRADENILDEICLRLTDDPHIDATLIEVEVRNAEVFISGTVENRLIKRMVEDTAERVRGVVHIENRLRVADS